MTKEFLTEHHIPFTDYNVATDQEKRKEMVELSGQMGVPVIQIGDQVVVGFDEDALSKMLGVKTG